MFNVGDVVEITEQSSATGMLDFVKGKGYEVTLASASNKLVHLKDESGSEDWFHYNHFKLKESYESVKKKECLFRKGQTVYDVLYGKGEVVGIYSDDTYPVTVQFDREAVVMAFTEDGKTYESYGRTLFFSEPEVSGATKPIFEATLKKGDVVIAFDQYSHGEKVVVFEELEGSIVNTEGTHFYKDAFDFFRSGDKVQFN